MHQLTKLGPDTLRSGSLNEHEAVPEKSVAWSPRSGVGEFSIFIFD